MNHLSMFYEHRMYFERVDLDALSSLMQETSIPFLGRECIEIEGAPVFQFQTDQPLDEYTRKQFLSLLVPSFVSWNNEMAISYEAYQAWLSTFDEAARNRLYVDARSADLLRAAKEQGRDDIPTQPLR